MQAQRSGGGGRRGGPMGGFGGGPPGMSGGEKARDFKGTVRKLLKTLSPFKLQIITVLIFAFGSAAFSIVGPKILARATNKLAEGIQLIWTGTGGIDFSYILNVLLWLVALYVFSALLSYIQGWIMAGVTAKVTYNLRSDISQKINRMPLRYFDGTNHGEVLSRITNDVDTVSQTLSQSLSQIITSATSLIGALVMMLSISWLMTLVTLVILPISMGLLSFVMKRSQKYFRQQQESLGNVNGHVEEMYGGHTVMKAFNGEQASVERFEKYNEELKGSAWKSQFLSGLMMPVMNFVGNLGYVAVCIMGGWMAANGKLNIGDIQAFIQYVRNFTQPISQIANVTNVLQQTAAAAERVYQFLEEDEEVPECENPVRVEPMLDIQGRPVGSELALYSPDGKISQVCGDITFKHVKFGYLPGKTIINDFNATVRSGQKIAIVGPTGAGKTTLVKLLMRFYDVDEGAIIIDGHDIREFTRNDLRSLFGMVLQDTWLYNGTIMENIRYGRLDATDEEVYRAARAAHAEHFIRALPESYSLVMNEEASNISQGQKQLLTIARAILADPKILILDEATSSVDTKTEMDIQRAMDNLMQGRTSFIIAHRLSTIRGADLILVMNDGDIVEQGTHDELMAANGFYAQLYSAQFEDVG